MKNLDELLGQGEPEERNDTKNYGLDALHITEYAFEKAYAYARLACRKAGRSIECGGYLIAPKGSGDRIATDAFLARNQEVSEGLFTIKAEDVIKAGREIDEMGYSALGWWHSHGFLRTFFSGTDDNGQITVLNEIGAFNYVTQMEEKEIRNLEAQVIKGKLVLFDRRNPEAKYEIETNGESGEIHIAGLRLLQERRIGFAYGLVVNAKAKEKKPYAEIAMRELCYECRRAKDRSVQTDIKLFEPEGLAFDENELMAEIKERVKMAPRFPKLFSWLETPISKHFGTPFGTPFGARTVPQYEKPGAYQNRCQQNSQQPLQKGPLPPAAEKPAVGDKKGPKTKLEKPPEKPVLEK